MDMGFERAANQHRKNISWLPDLPIHPLPHNPSHLELHCSLCRDLDRFQCLWVLRNSCSPVSYFKDSKIAKLQAVAFVKFGNYFIEEVLDYCFDDNMFALRRLRDSVDKILFCYCCVGWNSLRFR
jgi:hypothetical protein